MKVSELGEFGLIDRLHGRISHRQPIPRSSSATRGERQPRLLIGIGDDCAVWSWGSDTHISTTDTMVQDVHFSLDTTAWQDLGWKALAVNLSDIAAMAGIPGYALITLGVPPEAEMESIDALYDGLLECALAYETLLVGGDIVSAPVWFVSITVTGRPSSAVPFPNNVLLRSSARAGDLVAVTGCLGSSAAGLRFLQQDAQSGEEGPRAKPVLAHRRPVPRLETARLALDAGVRCGMDVSDGLIGDLEKICTASGLGAEIESRDLPVDGEVRAAFPDEWQRLALSGGEDYELLMTAPAEVIDAVRERTAVPVAVVGRITAGLPGKVTVHGADGRPLAIAGGGWDHLR